MVPWGGSWGVSTQVEAGKLRENCGWCEIFLYGFSVCIFVILGFLECGEGP